MTIDPITLEVVRGRLGLIAEQMQFSMIRSAYSTIVKEAGDVAAALFNPTGDLIAQASGVPILLGATIPAVARILEDFPIEQMADGDVYLLNDPYNGGTHLPDLLMVAPVFLDRLRIGLVCIVAHHVDLGGKTVGSLPVDATEIFQEGIRIPPVRLVREGVMDPALWRILRANSRFPSELSGDIEAQISACKIGSRGFRDLALSHGPAVLTDCIDELIRRSEKLTRDELRSIPLGRYNFVDYMDNDGIALDTRLRLEVTVEVAADSLVFDFTGTAAQTAGPFNASPSTVLAATYYVLRSITGASIPTNSGCFRPIRLVLPPGSIVNPALPAPVNARSMTFGILIDVLFGALAQAVPDRIPAASYEYPNISFGGFDPLRQKGFVINETACGGLGARPFADGIDVFRSKAGNSLNSPIEALEADTPLRVLQFGLRPGSGGAGRYRGGLGCIKVFELLRGEITVSHRGDRHVTPPYGLVGGQAGECSRSIIERADGTTREIPSKLVFRMAAGDRLHFHSAGGGGHGDPRMREAEAVATDLLNGKITRESALADYGHEQND